MKQQSVSSIQPVSLSHVCMLINTTADCAVLASMCSLCRSYMTWDFIIAELIPAHFFSKGTVKLAGVFNPCATTGRVSERYFHILHSFKASAALCQTSAWQIFRCLVFVLTVLYKYDGKRAHWGRGKAMAEEFQSMKKLELMMRQMAHGLLSMHCTI